MVNERQRTLHYKKAVLLSGPIADLQGMLNKLVKAVPDVSDREETDEDKTTRVLFGVGASHGMFTAKLMQFTPGQKQHILERDAKNKDYKLDVTAVPGGAAKKREFVESLTFVAVSSEHVMIVATLHLGSKALEDHLNWLLKRNGLIALDDHLLLVDQQSKKAEEQLAKANVDKVEIGGELDFEVVDTVPTQRKTKDRPTRKGHKLVRPRGQIADVLASVFGDLFEDVPLKQAIGRNERVKVKLELQYSNRKKTDEGFEMMQRLAIAGRHFDVDECRIHLFNGGYLRGDDLKVQVRIGVRSFASGLINEPDLWGRLHEWLLNAVRAGIVFK